MKTRTYFSNPVFWITGSSVGGWGPEILTLGTKTYQDVLENCISNKSGYQCITSSLKGMYKKIPMLWGVSEFDTKDTGFSIVSYYINSANMEFILLIL